MDTYCVSPDGSGLLTLQRHSLDAVTHFSDVTAHCLAGLAPSYNAQFKCWLK